MLVGGACAAPKLRWASPQDLWLIATLGSILDSQLIWESGKSQLARWSHNVALFSWNHHIACATLPPHSLRNPPHSLRNPPAAHLFFLLLGNLGSWNLVRCPNLQNQDIPKGSGHLCMQHLSWGLRILPHSAPSWIHSLSENLFGFWKWGYCQNL